MVDGQTYLNRLVGERLRTTELTTSTLLPINGNGKEILVVANSLIFEEYSLQINNPISISPNHKILEDLIDLRVEKAIEGEDFAAILFEGNFTLKSICGLKSITVLKQCHFLARKGFGPFGIK